MPAIRDEEKRIFNAILSERDLEMLPRLAEELHNRYHRLIHYLLRIFEIPDDIHQDLFNQIFVRIMKGLGQIKHCENIKSWVVTITKNEVFSFFLKHEREVRFYSGEDDSLSIPALVDSETEPLFPPEKEILGKQLRLGLQKSVSRLDEETRRPFLLRYKECLKWREIGTILGLNIDTARKRAEKARQQVLHDLHKRFGTNKLVLRLPM